MTGPSPKVDYLARILDRKGREVVRRRRHRRITPGTIEQGRGVRALDALRRPAGAPLRVIAEVKFRSPSAGTIRDHLPGAGADIARAYVAAGAAAVSVLADGPGFGGSALEVRRVARAVDAPVLFKEFVLDEIQIELARVMGASMVLLLVRALGDPSLRRLVDVVREHGMEPVVEAADDAELGRALDSGASIIGVNARDLRTFEVDTVAAARSMAAIPATASRSS